MTILLTKDVKSATNIVENVTSICVWIALIIKFKVLKHAYVQSIQYHTALRHIAQVIFNYLSFLDCGVTVV